MCAAGGGAPGVGKKLHTTQLCLTVFMPALAKLGLEVNQSQCIPLKRKEPGDSVGSFVSEPSPLVAIKNNTMSVLGRIFNMH